MSIERRVRGGRARWLVRWREGDRPRSRTFDRKQDAEAFEAEIRRRRQLGAHAPSEPSREPLEEWLKVWWQRQAPGWAPSTRSVRSYVIDKWLLPFIGRVSLRDLGRGRIEDWRTDIEAAGASHGTSNDALMLLSSALGAAARDGRLPTNPALGIRRRPRSTKAPRALTPQEVERIRAELPSLGDRVLVSLMAYAGLRPQEAVALRWSDVRESTILVQRAVSNGVLREITKTGLRRSVEIVAAMRDDLASLREHASDSTDDPIVRGARGARLSPGNWRNRVWNPATERAGVQGRPYDCRHTYASLLIHEGRPVIYVAAMLGHSTARLTLDTYAHLFSEADLVPRIEMAEAIRAARAALSPAQRVPSV